MIPNLRLNGTCGWAARVAVLALMATFSASCEKSPLLAPTGTTIRLTANTQVLPINGAAEITASVLEAGGYAVHNGTMVTFTTSLGTVAPIEVGTTDGKATVTFHAGTQAGTAVINAYSGSNSTSGSTSTGTGGATTTTGSGLSIVVGAAAANTLVLTASPSSLSQLGGTSVITATAYDTNNNALSGVQVAFSTDQGTLSPVSAITNGLGQAQTTLATTQAATVTATVGAKTGTVKVTTTALPTVSLTGPTALPTVGLTTTFSLTVTAGAASAPIRSVTVLFGDGSSVNLGAATGTISVPHVYSTAKSFIVTATATDSSGASTSTSVPVVVYAAVPFTVTVTAPSGKSGISITISAAVGAGAPAIDHYDWNFGDGDTALGVTTPTVPKTYRLAPGATLPVQFIVSVIAYGVDGRLGFGSAAVTIAP